MKKEFDKVCKNLLTEAKNPNYKKKVLREANKIDQALKELGNLIKNEKLRK